MLRCSSRLALVVSLLSISSIARADADPKRVTVSFRGPPDCEGLDVLAMNIERRSSRLRVDATSAENHVEVAIDKGTSFEATVAIDDGGERSERELSGVDCGELLDAIALIVVVTLDPTGHGSTESTDPEARTGGGDDASSAIDTPPEETPVAAPTRTPTPPPRYEDDYSPPDLEGPIDASSLVPNGFGVFAGARVVSGPVPALLLGPELGIEVLWLGAGAFSPRFEVSASRSFAPQLTSRNGNADFTLDQGKAALCPLELGQARWDLRPCLDGTFGRMLAEGSDTESPRTSTRPFASFGASGRASVRPVGILELWASVGIALALVRDRYQFEPVVFHEAPPELLTGAAGMGLSFR